MDEHTQAEWHRRKSRFKLYAGLFIFICLIGLLVVAILDANERSGIPVVVIMIGTGVLFMLVSIPLCRCPRCEKTINEKNPKFCSHCSVRLK
jgi:hypothetical protein